MERRIGMTVGDLVSRLLQCDPNERIDVMVRHRSGEVAYSPIVCLLRRSGLVDFSGLRVVAQSQEDFDAGHGAPLLGEIL